MIYVSIKPVISVSLIFCANVVTAESTVWFSFVLFTHYVNLKKIFDLFDE